MTSELETTRMVRYWLREGVTTLPDRVLDAVMDTLPRTPQRRRRWSIRFARGPRAVRLRPLVAILIVAAIVAAGLLVGVGALWRPGPGPTQMPTRQQQPLPAGRYAIGPPFELPLAFDVPAGWRTAEVTPGWVEIESDEPSPGGTLIFTFVHDIYADPCLHDRGLLGRIGPTAADLATALVRRPGLDVGPVTTTEVGAYPARNLLITAPGSFDGCAEPEPRFRVWAESPQLAESQRNQVWIVDAGTARLVIHGLFDGETSPATIGEIAAMVASIGFGERAVRPAPSSDATPGPSDPPFLHLTTAGPLEDGPYLTTMTMYDYDAAGEARPVPARDEVVFWGPGGWSATGHRLISDDDGPPDASFGWWAIGTVFADPCRWTTSGISDASTSGSMVRLVEAISRPHAAHPVDLPWLGRRTPYFEITVPPRLDPATCDGGEYRLWEDHDGAVRVGHPGEHIRVRVVDFEPGIAVIEYASMPYASGKTIAELMFSGPDLSITRVSGP